MARTCWEILVGLGYHARVDWSNTVLEIFALVACRSRSSELHALNRQFVVSPELPVSHDRNFRWTVFTGSSGASTEVPAIMQFLLDCIFPIYFFCFLFRTCALIPTSLPILVLSSQGKERLAKASVPADHPLTFLLRLMRKMLKLCVQPLRLLARRLLLLAVLLLQGRGLLFLRRPLLQGQT